MALKSRFEEGASSFDMRATRPSGDGAMWLDHVSATLADSVLPRQPAGS
jgi:hypothetical protein